jgi:hypothetical protein
MKTYGPLATAVAVWLTMLSPLIGFALVFLAALLLRPDIISRKG